MHFGVLLARVPAAGRHARRPAAGLTAHGGGIAGTQAAAGAAPRSWPGEKNANGGGWRASRKQADASAGEVHDS